MIGALTNDGAVGLLDRSGRVPDTVDGPAQLLYGSDRPVVEPRELGMPGGLDWEPIGEATRRALGAKRLVGAGTL